MTFKCPSCGNTFRSGDVKRVKGPYEAPCVSAQCPACKTSCCKAAPPETLLRGPKKL
jgi:hypothetical protein